MKDIPAPKWQVGWSIISTTIELVLPRVRDIDKVMKLTELIASAPWREAVTYRDIWPHEYVLSKKDGQREFLNAIYARFQDDEGVTCRFFKHDQQVSVHR